MAMKELFRVTLTSKQIKEACEAYISKRIDLSIEEATAKVPEDWGIDVQISKKRAPRKPKGDAA